MKRIVLQSPAKLNLFLKVINKRKDGYHNIKTLFERINLCDEITVAKNSKGIIRIFCEHPDVPKNYRNLAYKAAALIKDHFAFAEGVDIKIKKRIPVAAGLGGGSSNAATVILALNKLWKLSMTKEEMVDFGRNIGSDVPFFLHNHAFALGTSKGDVIKPLNIRKKLWHILIIPRTKVYSSQVYRAIKLELTKAKEGVNILIHALRRRGSSSLNGLLLNDLETAIVQLHPNLIRTKNRIKKVGPKEVSFSGSGPTIFSITRSQCQACAQVSVLEKYYKQVFVARTL